MCENDLVDVSDIFFCLERGKGESEAPEGGGGSLLKIPGEGGDSQGGGGAGVCGELGNLGGGGLNIFFEAETSSKTSEKVRERSRTSENSEKV